MGQVATRKPQPAVLVTFAIGYGPIAIDGCLQTSGTRSVGHVVMWPKDWSTLFACAKYA
jgi:hypothetical protein